MPTVLLIGAGSSRNWGGWLASETFDYLLGCPQVIGGSPEIFGVTARRLPLVLAPKPKRSANATEFASAR